MYASVVSIRGALPVCCVVASCAIALVAFASSAAAVGARVAVATSEPASGTWKITANHSQPGPSINDFDGSFVVKGGDVVELKGVTQHAVNSGCAAGQHVSMLGSIAVRHFLEPSIPSDYYYVGKVNGFANVSLTFQRSGRSKRHDKTTRGRGELRILFPGGTDTQGGFTAYSNLTYSSATAGICNLEFSVTAG